MRSRNGLSFLKYETAQYNLQMILYLGVAQLAERAAWDGEAARAARATQTTITFI